VADVPSGLSFTPPQEEEKKIDVKVKPLFLIKEKTPHLWDVLWHGDS
jgi:hypothetical protein